MKKKLITLGLVCTLALSAGVMTGCGSSSNTDKAQATEEAVYTPTFMYFVSSSDADFEAEKTLFNELKEEYGDKVKFDLHNIDETPEDKDNFPVDGMTPALIMLDTSNNISAMEFKCSDKDKLKSNIDTALNGGSGN